MTLEPAGDVVDGALDHARRRWGLESDEQATHGVLVVELETPDLELHRPKFVIDQALQPDVELVKLFGVQSTADPVNDCDGRGVIHLLAQVNLGTWCNDNKFRHGLNSSL